LDECKPLLADPEKGRARRVNLLGTSPFAQTFSAERRQKRPKLQTDDLAMMAAGAYTRPLFSST